MSEPFDGSIKTSLSFPSPPLAITLMPVLLMDNIENLMLFDDYY